MQSHRPPRTQETNARICRWFIICSVVVFLCAAATPSPAQNFKTLYQFTGSADGAYPVGPLIQGIDGNYYGATEGTTNGTIFDATAQGGLTTVGIIPGNSGPANLVLDNDGTYYGTELTGGPEFDGATFQLTPSGQFTVMYQFIGGTDGNWPSPLMQAADGNLYGTTYGGGDLGCNPPQQRGCGTVFQATRNGIITLYRFGIHDLGVSPASGLTQGPDGNLYGTTSAPAPGSTGAGSVFKITFGGKLTTLHQFCKVSGCPDGNTPNSTLVLGADGNFYGTTLYGGNTTCGSSGCGTIFRITPQGQLTTLYKFHGNWPLGYIPSGLMQATDGNLYGATQQGGDPKCGQGNGCGVLFRIATNGKSGALLHTFESTDGADPGSVVQGTNGLLYGAATLGGLNNCSSGCGTLFTFNVGAGQFVKTAPSSGAVATTVLILGNNLTGTSSVAFNGTAAQFTVVSPTEITTTVPTGATTGKITVNTPGGALVSNVNFIVTP